MTKFLSDITPYIVELGKGNTQAYLSNLPENITISCEAWDHIRTSQHAILFINDECITSMQLIAKHENLAQPPIFKVAVKNHLIPGHLCKIHIVVIEYDGTENPNQSTSAPLKISVQE